MGQWGNVVNCLPIRVLLVLAGDFGRKLQDTIMTLHINTCISLWTVQNCILQLPSEITGHYHTSYASTDLLDQASLLKHMK